METELRKVKRDGIENLILWLEKNKFYEAPASSMFHLNYEGGLVEHSLNVYKVLKNNIKRWKLNIDEESIIICGLLHDICKTNYYKLVIKPIKENGKWSDKEVYEKDLGYFPIGHGEKSVIMIQNFIKLRQDEIIALRFHMGAWTAGILTDKELNIQFCNAQKVPIVMALHLADMEAAKIVEEFNVEIPTEE